MPAVVPGTVLGKSQVIHPHVLGVTHCLPYCLPHCLHPVQHLAQPKHWRDVVQDRRGTSKSVLLQDLMARSCELFVVTVERPLLSSTYTALRSPCPSHSEQ